MHSDSGEFTTSENMIMSSCKSQDVSYGEGEDRNNNDVDLLKALGGE